MNRLFLMSFTIGWLCITNKYVSVAQGCSDAGFCTIGALKQHGSSDSTRSKLTLLLPLGLGDQSVVVFTPGIQYDRTLSANWAVQAKLTANYARGDLGQVAGPGDLFLSGTYSFPTPKQWSTSLTLGTKLPLHQANLKASEKALPMQYQSSLGTVDLITGISVSSPRWQFSAGWQKPLTGANRNTFLPVSDDRPEALAYPPSNQFIRRADVLGRVAYTVLNQSRLQLNAGLLGIVHLGQDMYTNPAGRSVSIAGSEGITLNVTLAGWWYVSPNMRLGFTAGIPLIVREVRPDGLTRSIVFAPEVSWLF